jgi:hypothetical protein
MEGSNVSKAKRCIYCRDEKALPLSPWSHVLGLQTNLLVSKIAVPERAVAIAASSLIFHFIFRRANQRSLQQR